VYVGMGVDGQRMNDQLLSYLLPYGDVIQLACWVKVLVMLICADLGGVGVVVEAV